MPEKSQDISRYQSLANLMEKAQLEQSSSLLIHKRDAGNSISLPEEIGNKTSEYQRRYEKLSLSYRKLDESEESRNKTHKIEVVR